MLMSSRFSAISLLLSGTLAAIAVACSNNSSTSNSNSPTTQAAPSPVKAATLTKAPSSPPQLPEKSASPNAADTYDLALDKAASADSISQSAQSADDWKLVVSRWQQALRLMEAVPSSSSNKAKAKTKLAEYQKKLTIAKEKANPPEPTTVVAINPNSSVEPGKKSGAKVFRAPIKYRLAGTAVIEVVFNGRQKFDMIVDTGASGVVITQRMADALGVVPVGKMKAQTPSHKAAEFPVGFVDSIGVDGMVMRDVRVAIAPQLNIGLLGQDFFSNYDVTIKKDVIEFRVR